MKEGERLAARKQKRGASARRKTAAAQKSGLSRQGAAVLLLAAAVLLGALALVPGVHAWRAMHRLLFGLFGPMAYALPVLCGYTAFAVAMDKLSSSVRARLAEAGAFLFFVCAILDVFAFGAFPWPGDIYASGVALASGGLAGGLFGAPLAALFGKTGALVTLFVLAAVDFFFFTGLTLMHIVRAGQAAGQKGREQMEKARLAREARAQARAEAAAQARTHPRRQTQIDVPLDSDPPDEAAEDDGTLSGALADLKERIQKVKEKKKPPAQSAEAEGEAPFPPAAPEEHLAADSPALVQPGAAQAEKAAARESAPQLPGQTPAPETYTKPPLTLLTQGTPVNEQSVRRQLEDNKERLEETLRSFGVETRVIGYNHGPTVTQYEVQPAVGVKISRITSLADDIALNLAATAVRIEAPIPGKAAVGIEIPNKTVNVVHIREILGSASFLHSQSRATIALGNDIAGNSIVGDVGKMPHLLIAGATGSGKSVCINSIIVSLLYKSSPKEVRLLMVDPKVVELGIYNGVPHLLVPVVTDPRKAAGALGWAVTEMENRYKQFAETGARDLRGYNEIAARTEGMEPMPQIVIIIDELADLMMVASKDVENNICRLAQKARAAGMHLVIATQRPSVDVITGVIKANIPSRIAFAVASQVDSRTILDGGGAEKLLGRGDMLFLPIGASKPMRIQGCFVSDEEVERVVDFVKQDAAPDYSDEVLEEIEKQSSKEDEPEERPEGDADAMLPQAIECVVELGAASTSLLQRRLKLGYARAARIVDEMEARGIVGPPEGSKPRQVLLSRQQWLEMQMNRAE